jgi:hypothetical protein
MINVHESEIAFRYWLNQIDLQSGKALCLIKKLVNTCNEVSTKEKVIEVLLEEYWHFPERKRQFNRLVEEIERRRLIDLELDRLLQLVSIPEIDTSRTFQIGVYSKESEERKMNLSKEVAKEEKEEEIVKEERVESEKDISSCPICYESDKSLNDYIDCSHKVCTDCFKKTLAALPLHKNPCCALCRCPITKIKAKTDEESTELFQIILGL